MGGKLQLCEQAGMREVVCPWSRAYLLQHDSLIAFQGMSSGQSQTLIIWKSRVAGE